MQLQEAKFPAVILAGGQGRRIGGDKAHVMLSGKPLWQHVLARIDPQVSRVAVNGIGRYDDLPVIADEVPDLGPLGGILAAMVWAQSNGAERVLTVAVDTPFLPHDLRCRLEAVSGPIVAARTTDGLHATTALWDVALADNLRNEIASGTRKVTMWSIKVGLSSVAFDEATPPPFFNINTPEDLAQAENWLA